MVNAELSNVYDWLASIHSYKTSSSGDYVVKPSRLDKQIESFSINGVKIWSSLPCEIRHLSKNNFKIKFHSILLQRLSEENDYIDLSVLITKIY